MEILFKTIAAVLLVMFVGYGMDIRRKLGARKFVSGGWQVMMKICSFSLIIAFVGITSTIHEVNATDWLGLVAMASGTACVVAAKRALGRAHTFTGEYLEKPTLVTWGIYRFSRNPLYLGVFQCEIGAALVVVSRASVVWPGTQAYWLAGFAATLLYAVAFNLRMAVWEARYLRQYFGEEYHRYSEAVPFLIPSIRSGKEVV